MMRKFCLALASWGILSSAAFAVEGPPTSNGVISNPTLVANQAIAKAQAVGAITTFMGKGTEQCDEEGKNCRSLFGADDSLDYAGVQMSGQSTTGIQSFSFQSGSSGDDGMDTNAITSQTGSLVLACGDKTPKTIAGIAFRVSACAVNPSGDAQMTFQVCTGPVRGNPVVAPEKTMECSTDPTSPNFRPKEGYSCVRPTCASEPQGSLNGWSAPTTVTYSQSVAANGTADQKAANGLGMSFYPALGAGIPANFSADSDNMAAVKLVQTAINSENGQTAIGLRVAFRHKVQVTKEMMIQGPSAVPNPSEHSAQWDTILKLQGNALIPQYQATYSANGSECMQQIQNGLSTDGVVSVCDQGYVNESGIRPGALTAQMAAEGQNCGTTAQCLEEVVNTNTWEQTCSASVPLSIRKCTTKTDFELETLSYTRTKSKEVCTEERATSVQSCNTSATIGAAEEIWAPASDLSFAGSTSVQTVLKFARAFNVPKTTSVIQAKLGVLNVDNWGEIRLNGTRVWSQLNRNLNNVKDADTYTNCDNESWKESYQDSDTGQTIEYTVQGVRCTMTNGTRVQADYNNDCIGTCKTPVRVDLDIPLHLVKINQENVFTMSCFNSLGISACNFTAELKYFNVTKYEVNNACSGYEAAR